MSKAGERHRPQAGKTPSGTGAGFEGELNCHLALDCKT